MFCTAALNREDDPKLKWSGLLPQMFDGSGAAKSLGQFGVTRAAVRTGPGTDDRRRGGEDALELAGADSEGSPPQSRSQSQPTGHLTCKTPLAAYFLPQPRPLPYNESR